MIYIALLLYVLAFPFVIDSLRGKWPSVVLWPVVALVGTLVAGLEVVWDNRPRWYWRRAWRRRPAHITHYGFKTKAGKLCGIIVSGKVISSVEKKHYATFSGLCFVGVRVGTLTKLESW